MLSKCLLNVALIHRAGSFFYIVFLVLFCCCLYLNCIKVENSPKQKKIVSLQIRDDSVISFVNIVITTGLSEAIACKSKTIHLKGEISFKL